MTSDPTQPRMALRPLAAGGLDDVVVRDVSMFRAELLNETTLWLACYLPGTGVVDDRVGFEVSVRDGRLAFDVIERPAGGVSVEGM